MNPTPDAAPAADPVVVIRRIRAPRERVFRAWTTPEELRRWWRLTPHHTPDVLEIDLRVGGTYRLGMIGPTGTTYAVSGAYRDVTPPSRLVYSWQWTAPQPSPPSLVTVEFVAVGPDATDVIVTHSDLPDAASRRDHDQGWTATTAALARALEEAP